MLKTCLILSLHIAVSRGDGSLILRFGMGMYHLREELQGRGGTGWAGGRSIARVVVLVPAIWHAFTWSPC